MLAELWVILYLVLITQKRAGIWHITLASARMPVKKYSSNYSFGVMYPTLLLIYTPYRDYDGVPISNDARKEE
jgi:hypothetical protein